VVPHVKRNTVHKAASEDSLSFEGWRTTAVGILNFDAPAAVRFPRQLHAFGWPAMGILERFECMLKSKP
jgi:hypothetical protein